MNHKNPVGGAATSPTLNRVDAKKSVNTKASPALNFQIGLIVVLLLALVVIESTSITVEKVYAPTPKKEIYIEPNVANYTIQKEVPKVVAVKKKATPSKPIVKPKVSNLPPVIDDTTPDNDEQPSDPETDTPTKDDSTEVRSSTDKTTPVTPTGPTHVLSVMEVPLFPGCEISLNREERIDCLNQKMGHFIQRKFDISVSDLDSGRAVRIQVMFTIGTDGFAKDIKVRAPNKELEEEALRVIKRLPKMVPGKNNGVAVNVTYSLPIIYRVN